MHYNINLEYASSDGYFLLVEDSRGWQIQFDDDIADLFGLSVDFYYNKAIEYGAHKNSHNQLFFHNKTKILKFKKWIEKNIDGFLIAKKLEEN